MTDPRLKQLREEFEAVREAYLAHEHDFTDECHTIPPIDEPWVVTTDALWPHLTDWNVDQWAIGNQMDGEENKPVEVAARRYVIARDFNEYREGHWQALWKLQNGGAS